MTQAAARTAWARLSSDDEAALRSYFTEGDGDETLKCSLGAMIKRAEEGGDDFDPSSDAAERRMAGVQRRRRIRDRLLAAGVENARVLWLYYAPEAALSPGVRRELAPLGRAAGVMLLTPALAAWRAGRGFVEPPASALRALADGLKGKPSLLAVLVRVRHESDAMLAAACRAYRESRASELVCHASSGHNGPPR